MQTPVITKVTSKKLIGLNVITSLNNYNTGPMWQRFMPIQKNVINKKGNDLYCVQVYADDFDHDNFTSNSHFTSWSAIEVEDFENIPESFESLVIESGLYAVFKHKGATSSFPITADYIFNHWIPQSEYELDDRPHFEILGELYFGPDNPESEEEVWIPIKPRNKTIN